MSSSDLQAERRRLGPLLRIEIEAASLAAAHGQLSAALGPIICRVAKQRKRATPAAEFERQLAAARSCLHRLSARIESRHTLPVLQRGLAEYRDCLSAWAEGSELAGVAAGIQAGGQGVTPLELALWLQDDNAGCQTGLLRLAGGGVLFWHTEEDTIGYFDRPRLAALTAGGQTWHALLYPYLLPGPAFGWHDGWFHAVDSLHLARSEHGTLTAVAAWLAWRSGPEVFADLIKLTPFIDGCAIHCVSRGGQAVAASVQELGWLDVRTRTSGRRTGSLVFQANCVERLKSRIGRREALTPAERERYCARGERTRAAIAPLIAAEDATPERILELLASRRGGGYAYANADVKAHCVGIATAERMEIYAQSGAALPGDPYQPQFFA